MPDEATPDDQPHPLDEASRPKRDRTLDRWGVLGDLLREEGSPYLLDPKFRLKFRQYFFQAALATIAMAVILLFVDSLSTAAVAAGLGSSVIGIFINPTGATARIRAVVGGHTMALLLGSVFSLILFAGGIESFIADHSRFHALMMALSVGMLILIMAITDTEHPPAAGIAIGMASREWTPEVFGAILGAAALLGATKLVLKRNLQDLL